MALLERVKHILIQKGMAFTDLANLMDSHRQSLHTSLKSENIRYSTLKRIAEVLEVSPCALVSDENLPDNKQVEKLEEANKVLVFYVSQSIANFVSLKHNMMTMEDADRYYNNVEMQLGPRFPDLITKSSLEAAIQDADARRKK
jgi:DNA-binding Xre family transcriptional regulator